MNTGLFRSWRRAKRTSVIASSWSGRARYSACGFDGITSAAGCFAVAESPHDGSAPPFPILAGRRGCTALHRDARRIPGGTGARLHDAFLRARRPPDRVGSVSPVTGRRHAARRAQPRLPRGAERTERPFTWIARALTSAGYAVLVPERRGYGQSGGRTFTEEVGDDRAAAFISRLQPKPTTRSRPWTT